MEFDIFNLDISGIYGKFLVSLKWILGLGSLIWSLLVWRCGISFTSMRALRIAIHNAYNKLKAENAVAYYDGDDCDKRYLYLSIDSLDNATTCAGLFNIALLFNVVLTIIVLFVLEDEYFMLYGSLLMMIKTAIYRCSIIYRK